MRTIPEDITEIPSFEEWLERYTNARPCLETARAHGPAAILSEQNLWHRRYERELIALAEKWRDKVRTYENALDSTYL